MKIKLINVVNKNLRDLIDNLTISLVMKAKVVIPAPKAPALFLIYSTSYCAFFANN